MAIEERSAGFVVFRAEAAQGRRLYLLLDCRRHWGFAKGHGKEGETDHSAARRELMEETSITEIRVVEPFAHEIRYEFFSHKGRINKSVVFFLAEVQSDAVTLSDEHVAYVWLPYDEALAKLTYENTRTVLRAAEAFLIARGTSAAQ